VPFARLENDRRQSGYDPHAALDDLGDELVGVVAAVLDAVDTGVDCTLGPVPSVGGDGDAQFVRRINAGAQLLHRVAVGHQLDPISPCAYLLPRGLGDLGRAIGFAVAEVDVAAGPAHRPAARVDLGSGYQAVTLCLPCVETSVVHAREVTEVRHAGLDGRDQAASRLDVTHGAVEAALALEVREAVPSQVTVEVGEAG